MEFPSGSSEGSNNYVSISGRVGRIDDFERVMRLTILLEYFWLDFCHSSYLTDSTNSPFCQFFVNQQKVCGEVSYNLYENSVVAFEFVFSNVDQHHTSKIRDYFDTVIRSYSFFSLLLCNLSVRSSLASTNRVFWTLSATR